jgi:exonuclease III
VSGDLELWSKEWGGAIYISSGTSHSKGVAILIPKNMTHKINNVIKDQDGRYLLINGIFNEKELTLLNVYAPQPIKPKSKWNFYKLYLNILMNIATT